jgi:hypothetical protein
MKCRKCQSETPPVRNFCGECGARLEVICPNCAASNPPHFTFCGVCGLNLGSSAVAAPPTDLSFDEKLCRIQKYLACKSEKAETVFQDMRMEYWLAKAQEALARL